MLWSEAIEQVTLLVENGTVSTTMESRRSEDIQETSYSMAEASLFDKLPN